MAGNLGNCSIESNVVVTGLEVTDNDIANQILYIVPTPQVNPWDPVYTVAAAAFKDNTMVNMPPENWDGVIVQDPGNGQGGGLDITFTDTLGANVVDNKVKVTINLEDDFFLHEDRTITLDLSGNAVENLERTVIVALKTDFENQVRGGNISYFNENTGPYSTNYSGKKDIVNVTFTPNSEANLTNPSGGTFPDVITTTTPSASNLDNHNDPTTENEVIYVKGTFSLDRSGEDEGWVRLGTIEVKIDNTVLNSAVASNQVPSSSDGEGEYGFIYRKPSESGNSFTESSSAISKEVKSDGGMSPIAVHCHQLRDRYEVANVAQDTINDIDTADGSIKAGCTYTTWESKDHPWEADAQESVKTSATDKDYVCTTWKREWWFRLPVADDGYDLTSETNEFWHDDTDISSGITNNNNDLVLSGFLAAASPPADESVKYINNIYFETQWEEMDMNTVAGWVGPTGEDANANNKAWLIPREGNNPNNSGQVLRVEGESGAKFVVEIDEVEVITRNSTSTSRGSSSGSGGIGTPRNLIQWDTVLDESGNNEADLGTTLALEIPDGSTFYQLALPTIAAHTGVDDYKNFYLRVIAVENTEISVGAHSAAHGADISSNDWEESFSNGINYAGPNNTLQIRLRQHNTSAIVLKGNIDNFSGVSAHSSSGSLTTTALLSAQQQQGFQGVDGDGALNYEPLVIDFRWVLEGGTGEFKFNPNFHQYHSGGVTTDYSNDDGEHDSAWGSGHNCTVVYDMDTNPDGQNCSVNNINAVNVQTQILDYLDMSEDERFLYQHNFPIQGTVMADPLELSINGVFDPLLYEDGDSSSTYTAQMPNGWTYHAGNRKPGSFTSVAGGALELNMPKPGYTLSANLRGETYLTQKINLVAGKTYEISIDINSCGPTDQDSSVSGEVFSPPQVEARLLMYPPGAYVLNNEFHTSSIHPDLQVIAANDIAGGSYGTHTYTYTPTASGEYRFKLHMIRNSNAASSYTSSQVCEFDNFSVVEINLPFTDYNDHTDNTNGEDVNISGLKAVIGKVTAWDGSDSSYTIDTSLNATDNKKYLSVMGRFRVNSFGTDNNEYTLDISKIATWEGP